MLRIRTAELWQDRCRQSIQGHERVAAFVFCDAWTTNGAQEALHGATFERVLPDNVKVTITVSVSYNHFQRFPDYARIRVDV